ncbi:hypothetical protein T484DRAFT_1793628, partial [Baffinella frigidus]
MAHLTRSPAGVAMLLAVACLGLHSPAGAFHGTLPVPSTFARRTAQLRPPARGRAASIRHGAVMTAVEPRVAAAAHDVTPTKKERVRFYDTTLRDGAQGEGISLSCDDKLRIAARLHRFGADYIEGGWPGSNPKDAEFFRRARTELSAAAWDKLVNLRQDAEFFRRAKTELSAAAWDKVAAFGSTRYKNIKVEDDKQVQMLVDSGARVITLVGKAWDLHVDQVLETTREENLGMIRDTVRYLKDLDREVMLDAEHFFDGFALNGANIMLDAEHFFDGFALNEAYAMECLSAAVESGVDWLVLCDTNGGTLPWDIEQTTKIVREKFPDTKVGIHCHNDQGMAVANSIASVRGGASVIQLCAGNSIASVLYLASVIQGTVNGYGERTGNANVMSILPTLVLSMETESMEESALKGLTSLSRYANQPTHQRAAYVGASAFAVRPCFPGASNKEVCLSRTDPESVGNNRIVPVSMSSSAGSEADKDDPRELSPTLLATLRKYGGEEE